MANNETPRTFDAGNGGLNIRTDKMPEVLNSYQSFRKVLADCALKTTQYALYIQNDKSYDLDLELSALGQETYEYNAFKKDAKKESRPKYDENNPRENPFLSQFMVSAVNMPNRYSGMTTVNFQGRQIRLAGNAALYDPLVCMITENVRCEGLKFFNKWCDEIQSIVTGLSGISTALVKASHCRQVYLIVFNESTLTVFHFANSFPLLIGSADFTWHNENVVSFPVHLSFDYVKTMGPYIKDTDEHYEKWYKLAHSIISQ